MTDFFVRNSVFQGSSAPTVEPRFYIRNNFYQGTSHACIVDLIAPIFAGIASLSVQTLGQLRVTWLTGTDISLPIRYEVYISQSVLGLFNLSNIAAITDKLLFDVFELPNGTPLIFGTTYYVGVRAVDGVGNRDNNIVHLSVVAPGFAAAAATYNAEGAFSIDTSNQFRGTIWGLKNSQLFVGSMLGQARYEIYDRAGVLVTGMSQNNINADANGQFIITPVVSTLDKTLDHYVVKVQIAMDGVLRTGYVPLIEEVPEYEIHGAFSLDTSNQLTASFWTTADEQLITNPARLGTASYQVYDKNGAAVVGMAESGIAADANGLFKITPVASSLSLDLNYYSVKVTIGVDSVARTDFLPIIGKIPEYHVENLVALDSISKLQGAFWIEASGKMVSGGSLGTASYQVYDHAGAPIGGLSESGLVADVNGRFQISTIDGSVIDDVTHCEIKFVVLVDGVSRIFWTSLGRSEARVYESRATFSINALNQFQGTLWATVNGKVRLPGTLGAASYTIYDPTGAPVSGMTQSGIVADANGRFALTPMSAVLLTDLVHYSVRVGIIVDGVERVSYRGFTLLGN